MLRLFSALILMLGTFALAGCQSTSASAPESAQPAAQMEVNHEMCCKHDGSCDRACHHECKMKGIHCHHKAMHKHHHKAKAKKSEAEPAPAASSSETQPAATQPAAAQ